MRKFVPVLILLALSFLQAEAGVIYVNLNATGNNDGSSWTNAFTGFQTAIDVAISGDSIFVASGIYQPVSGTSFTMKEGVKIFGGFLGTESSFGQRNPNHRATLQGNGNSVIINDNNGLTSSAVLDAFIITGGYSNGRGGGGIFNLNSSPAIRNCVFSGNKAEIGAGVYNYTSASPTIINCLFSDNSANTGGGAIYNMINSSPAIINCIFSGNTGGNGGAIYNGFQSAAVFTNCVISGNTAGFGGGMYNTAANPVITNTIIWNNTGYADGNGIYNLSAAPVITYSDLQDGIIGGTGNISQDPLFTDLAGGDYTLKSTSPCIDAGNTAANIIATDLAGNPRVAGTSVDIGAYELQGTTVPVDLVHFKGSIQNGIVTLQWESGAESNLNRYVIEKSTDGLSFVKTTSVGSRGSYRHYTYSLPQIEPVNYYRLEIVDNSGKKTYSDIIRLAQNSKDKIAVYPNPARNNIWLNVPEASKTHLYNLSGVLLRTISLQAGLNKINIQSLSTGVYFFRIGRTEIKFVKL